jgi:hypothetical protein
MSHSELLELAKSELVAGDYLTREEFLRRWEASPMVKFAELIRGIVYMPAPVRIDHGKPDFRLTTWLGTYEAATPGCEGCTNTTWLMEGQETPQPDACLRILPEWGGLSHVVDNYPAGAPEFLGEVCLSSTSFDLHQKLEVYGESGVREYLALLIKDQETRWHRLRDGKFEVVPKPADGIYRSQVFPGLWFDAAAMLAWDLAKELATLQQGLASPEHAAFVAELAARRRV